MKNQAWTRRLLLAGAASLVMLTAGDTALTQVVAADVGIDPLEILSLTISPNVAIIVDTSGSMEAPFNATDGGKNNPALGGDDFSSKMYQAKKALKTVIAQNAGIANFGLLSYAVRNADKDIVAENNAWTSDADRTVKYVTDQPSAAFWTGDRGKTGIDTTTDFFDTDPTPNTGTGASAVYNSFGAFSSTLDMGTSGNVCTDPAQCRWFLSSVYVRSNVRYRWTNSTTMTASTIDCSTDANRAPLRLFPDDPHTIVATKTDYNRPCVQMENSSGVVTTFWYTSATWSNLTSQCTGAALITAVPGCMNNDPQAVLDGLKLELPVDGSCQNASSVTTPVGAPCGITPTGAGQAATTIHGTNPALDPNAMQGLLAGGYTPIEDSLRWVNANRATVFANQVTGQPNYVILVTDGEDSCGPGGAGTSTPPADQAAAAGALYANGITVFVIAMGIDPVGLNGVASSGSGGQYAPFSAQNPQGLIDALNSIINQTAQAGDFAAQPSISASVFEFGGWSGFPTDERIDPFEGDPREVDTYRFSKVVPLTFQPMFEMPGFVGHLRAFIAATADNPVQVWDAGDMLCRQVTGYPATTTTPAECDVTGAHADAMGNGSFTFEAMTGTDGGAPNYTQTTGRLRRRIFTTSGNGVFPYAADLSAGAGQVLVPLWPPTTTTDPAGVDPGYDGTSTYPTGRLDAALGIEWLDFATLQTTFAACRVGTVGVLHAHCSVAATQLSRARKEAREMILAYAAGAMVATTGGLPNRTDNSGPASGRGEILYKAKDWILAEATLSSVVAVTQPLPATYAPNIHNSEFKEYSRVYREAVLPRMSVVYYGANDMLHAFRAGPAGADPTAHEQGGQELWGFVPFDQLSKVRLLLLEGQNRSNHKYVIASGLRAADVFVPNPSTPTTGQWRTYLFFGRGMAGKHYTALDVSTPGDFTTPALATTPPLAVWTRGNPDTQDGLPPTPAGSPTNANYLTNAGGIDLGQNDVEAYGTMGLSWSTPALARVRNVTEATDPTPGIPLNEGLEFMLYMGSGYSSVATEGHSFYAVNPLTGDIITRADVGSGNGSSIPNAIVADVAVFNPGQLRIDAPTHPASTVGTHVYVGDLHGRLWKFPTDNADVGIPLWDFGVSQPVAAAVGLLNYDSQYDATPSTELKPHIYVTTGNDRRVPTPPAAPADFLFVGLRDDLTSTAPYATELFSYTLPARYRGTTQPSTFLTSSDQGASARVVVAVTRYNPVTAATCRSSFDSLIYLVSAGLGAAAFDVNSDGAIDDDDKFWEIEDEKVTGVRVTHGQLVVDKGLDPPPDKVPPMKDLVGGVSGSPVVWSTAVNSGGSTVCRQGQ